MMNRTRIALALAASAALLAVASCGSGSDPLASGGSTKTASAGTIVVGSANFPENALLAEIYAGALSSKGVTVEKKLNIGSRETYIPALKDGSIDLIPEYTGRPVPVLQQERQSHRCRRCLRRAQGGAPRDAHRP